MTEAYLILDAGTGAGRALVVDETGQVRSAAYQEWSSRQEEGVIGGVFYDPKELENTLWDCASYAVQNGGIDARQIKAVAVTTLREGVVFLDAKGRELYVGPSFDARADLEGTRIAEQIGEEIYFTCGTYPPTYGYAARLAWFKDNRPDVYRQIHNVLTMGDWINYLLCGELFSEPSLASASGLFDIRKADWSVKLVSKLGLDQKWFPPILPAGQRVGQLRADIAARIGLPEITSVVVGGGDTQCALLGMGLVDAWAQGCVAGTTSPIQQITDEPIFDPHMRTWTNCQLVPGKYALESNAIATGLSYRWLREILGPKIDYESMNTLAENADPGSHGVFSFLGAEIMDMTRYRASWTGGFLFPVPPGNVQVADFIRSLLESHAYAVRANVEQIESISGHECIGLHVCGGQSACSIGMQILSTVLQRPVHIHTQHCSALGAAMCAAVGVANKQTLGVAASEMAGASATIEPDGLLLAFYEDRFAEWKSKYQQLRQMAD